MSKVLEWALAACLGCLTIGMAMALVRVFLGPRAEDRVLAYDCLYLNTMLVVLALGLVYQSSSYFEAALLIAFLGFVSSAAISKFLLRGEIIE